MSHEAIMLEKLTSQWNNIGENSSRNNSLIFLIKTY